MLPEADMDLFERAAKNRVTPDEQARREMGEAYLSRITRELILGDESMLPDKDIHIDDIDMDFVQMLITAVNESKLNQPEKEVLRKKLDRWQNALMLTHTIRVTF